MTPLRQQMIAALQLSGKGERTQEAYVREVRLLAQFYGKSPHLLSAPELQHYFLHRKNVDGLAPASMRICSSGIRCFSQHVLKRDWHTLSLMRAHTAHRLPAVLSLQEVRRLLDQPPPGTIRSTSPPSTAWDSGSTTPSPSRLPTWTLSVWSSMSIAARAPRTVLCLCPKPRWLCYGPLGQPTTTTPGAFLPPGGINNNVLPPLFPCADTASRAPAAQPHAALA